MSNNAKTLADYYERHKTEGLMELSEKTGLGFGYVKQLLYNTKKRPSVDAALKIIDASRGEINLRGLVFPREISTKRVKQ